MVVAIEVGDSADPIKTPSDDGKKPKQSLYGLIVDAQASKQDVRQRLISDLAELMSKHSASLEDYKTLFLFEPNSISSFAADQIHNALKSVQPKNKNILLIIHSTGGSIEPAYQISKLCKHYAREKFIVAIPRKAKSAATLISLGGDEIHMGVMSEIGPIDPQLASRPVLGLRHSLKIIAEICSGEKESAEMFASYLTKSLYVPDIGYYDRLAESAVQYAVRLLMKKKMKKDFAVKIARKLVNEYKDHGFVIDREEAEEILSDNLIKKDSKELEFAEDVHQLIMEANLWLGTVRQAITFIGDAKDILILPSE